MIATIIFSNELGDHCVITNSNNKTLLEEINQKLVIKNIQLGAVDMLLISMKNGYHLLSDNKTKISIK